MDAAQYSRLGKVAIYLCACALHGETPKLNNDIDLTTLYRFCQFHSITAMTAMALERCPEIASQPERINPWMQAKNKVIRKNILLNAERQRILQHLESIGCWYMPLKGVLLQDEYPQFGMRQMSDNDILYDPEKQEAVYDFMIASGYRALSYGKTNHDEYVKEPVYNFEMHKSLFHTAWSPELERYYRDINKKLVKDPHNEYGYHLSVEDFYIYMIAHNYKHHILSGIGLRSLLDVYVFLQSHGNEMQEDYVRSELTKLGCSDYEAACRAISYHLLSSPQSNCRLSDEEEVLFRSFACSGTHGTEQMLMENTLQKLMNKKATAPRHTKLRYIWQRLFPSAQALSPVYPQALKKPWLIPFFWIHRHWKTLLTKPKVIARELKELLQRKNK